jgi:LysM repeat protein
MRRCLPLLAAAAVLAFAGCTGKPENSPYIRNKFAQLDETKKDTEQLRAQLAAISGDLNVLSEQIRELRALAPDSTGTSEVIQRLNSLEKRIASMDGKAAPATLRTNSAPAPAGGSTNPDSATTSRVAGASDVPKPVTELAPPAGVDTRAGSSKPAEVAKAETKKTETKKAETRKAETMNAAIKPGEKKASTTQATIVQTKSAGKYYTVQAGDTVQSIANAHGITVDVLLKENRIPAGARVPKGQRLYIPGAK